MAKKIMNWKTKGMNRDLSVSAFNPEFAFENHNLRLSTNENNTLMSWVNEKGTAKLKIYDTDPETPSEVTIDGVAIGTAVLNHKLVLFTTNCGVDHNDKIYLLWYSDLGKIQMQGKVLYEGNLSFDVNYPLETLVSYESEIVQKVYWTDGKNQPRVINIANEDTNYDDTSFDFIPTLKLKETVKVKKELGATGVFAPGVIQYAFTYYRKYGQESCIFYTTPLYYISYKDRGGAPDDRIENAFKITVENPDTNFDYLRIYSIQRTSINGTPICKRIQDIRLDGSYDPTDPTQEDFMYSDFPIDAGFVITKNGGPAAPDITDVTRTILGVSNVGCVGYQKAAGLEISTGNKVITFGENSTVNSVIWITMTKITYDGVEAYYAVETTDNTAATRETLTVTTVPNMATYVDNGTSGDTIDPTELLYKGGEEIAAFTMDEKDSTLFLGNLEIKRKLVEESLGAKIKQRTTIAPSYRYIYTPIVIGENTSESNSYKYSNQLTAYKDYNKTESVPCAGFKCGDYYRCGIQFQHKTGRWSDPIFIDDVQSNIRSAEETTYQIKLPILEGTLSNTPVAAGEEGVITSLINNGYVKARAVVVYPEVQDRVVLCQGIANPTLYTDEHRTWEDTDHNTRGNNDLYAQASWFFRPGKEGGWLTNAGAVWPKSQTSTNDGDTGLEYTSKAIGTEEDGGGYDPQSNIRRVEIQGDYNSENKFKITRKFLTLNSPDVEFDDYLTTIDFENAAYKQIGKVYFEFTMADIDIQTESPAISNNASGFIHKAYKATSAYGIVSGTFFEDYVVDDLNHDNNASSLGLEPDQRSPLEWMVYLWNKTGSLNNDIVRGSAMGTPTAVLKKKIISNLRYTKTYFNVTADPHSVAPQLYNSDEATILKFGNKIYRGNIDTVLTPDNADGMYCTFDYTNDKPDPGADGVSTSFTSEYWWKTFSEKPDQDVNAGLWKRIIKRNPDTQVITGIYWGGRWKDIGDHYISTAVKKDTVRMKYKSAPHLAFGVATSNNGISWDNDYLPILEIVNTINAAKPDTLFGGTSADALRENVWIPCGEPVDLADANNTALSSVTFKYEYGDTYFQRYDCLKTYAFTHEDINQVVEIGSFMLETRVNIDGRYDRNRGQLSNLYMSPQNFNLINPVYSQINNFFSYKIMDEDSYKNTVFPNQITWSKTKQAGADVDLWTNVTLASILELDGDKGSLNKLARFNDQLLAFQDTGISQVLYNENVQISSTQGVPIEIANSGKVQGKRYISDTIGCFNKWSVVSTPMGLYFMDSNDKSIYQFNGQLSNLSIKGGMNTWCKKEIPTIAESLKWTPDYLTGPGQIPVSAGFNNFVAYYDKQNQDVLFINKNTSLAFSEKIGAFTSFYAYGKSAYLCNLDDTGVWIKNMHLGQSVGNIESTALWKHQAGDYCKFFGRLNAYSMTLVGNPEPLMDKIFTNLEFRASVDGDGSTTTKGGETVFNKFYLPFDKLEAWDEYQHGITTLSIMNGHNAMLHGGTTSSLKRKFRIWRCDIPRDNAELSTDAALGISRYSKRPNDRMRNPWLYLKLTKIPKTTLPETPQYRTEIHDVMMTYFD